jgi:hypothetical protein
MIAGIVGAVVSGFGFLALYFCLKKHKASGSNIIAIDDSLTTIVCKHKEDTLPNSEVIENSVEILSSSTSKVFKFFAIKTN